MRIVNRVLGLLIATALAVLSVLVIVEVVAYYLNDATPALVDYRPWLEWAERTPWAERALAVGGIIAAVVGLIWLLFEIKPTRVSTLRTRPEKPGLETVYTRRGLESAVESSVGVLDGVRGVNATARRRTITVSALAAGREPAEARKLEPSIDAAAKQRVDELQLERAPRVKVRVLTARK